MAQVAKVGRNDTCSCGSGKKFKKCCGQKQPRSRGTVLMGVLVGALLLTGLLAAMSSFTSETTHTGRTTGVWSPEHGHYH